MQTPIITNMTVKWNPFARMDRGLARTIKWAKLAIKGNIVAEVDQEIMKDLLWASNAVSSL